MEELDPGHNFLLASFDGGEPVRLTFVKRCNPPEKYPGNVDAHPGTQSQEVLRVLIARALYVNNQTPCPETEQAIVLMREAIWLFESRHARVHGESFGMVGVGDGRIEELPFCKRCGHILCFCPEGELV